MFEPALPFPFVVKISPRFILQIWDKLGGKDMIKNDQTIQLGKRWATALKKRYGRCVKRIANDFGVEVRTARHWIDEEQTPYAVNFMRAWELHGIPFINETLNPNRTISSAEIQEALAEVRSKLEKLSDEIVLLLNERGE